MIIKTKNPVLRPYSGSDKKELFENFNDLEVNRFLCRAKYPFTLKDAEKWIKKCSKDEKEKPRKEFNFAIEKNKHFVGSIGISNIEKHQAEIGYWVGRKYWNQGIMTESVDAIIKFAFNKLKLIKVYAYVFLKNKKSETVLKKNGFKKEGLLRKHRLKNGKPIDMYVYSKLK